MPTPNQRVFEVFYDGACPLCLKEINVLRRLNKRDRLGFIDIAAADFDERDAGFSYDTLMASIHGRKSDGTIVEGFEVFRQLYSAVGFSWVVAMTRIPGISHLLERSYRVFAKRRLRLTGRCDADGCRIDPAPVAGQ